MYNLLYSFIFVHIPKTGGTTIRNMLQVLPLTQNVSQHMSIQDYKKIKINYNKMFKFSVVRNPYDLTVSRFFFYKNIWSKKPIAHEKNKITKMNFSDFVKNTDVYLESHKDWTNPKTFAHKNYTKDEYDFNQFSLLSINNKIECDHVYKFENMKNNLKNICERFGIDDTESNSNLHFNKGKRDKYQKYYDSETKKIIAKRFEKDIDHFKYIF